MMPDKDFALLCHRLLARTRALNAALELHRARVQGPVLTGLGAEGLSVGIGIALMAKGILADSVLHGDHRAQYGFAVTKNEVFPEAHDHAYEILKNHALTATSIAQGEDGNIHWGCLEHGILPFACSDMGRMASIVVGISEEMRRTRWNNLPLAKRPVAIGVCGEGAINQGGVAEAMNWVAASNCRLTTQEFSKHEPFLDDIGRELWVLRGAPTIFVINRNQFSIYTDAREEHGRSQLALRASGYGNMKGVSVMGWDIFDVIQKTTEAIENAQRLISTLLDMDTYRLTGHNADQIKRKENQLNQGETLDVTSTEFARAWEQYDPLKHCHEDMIAWGFASHEELMRKEEEEMQRIERLIDCAFQEPAPTLEDRKKKTLFLPFPEPRNAHSDDGAKKRMRYHEALVGELAGELRADPRITIFGEDIHYGGVLGETAGRKGYLLSREFGEVRVHTTPLSEEALTGVAVGRALMGGKPKLFYQFAPFWADSYPMWRAVIATNWWQKKMKFDVVACVPFGVVHSGGSGEYHEACIEGPLYAMGGIVLLFPATAYDVVGMLRSAHEYEGPVVIFLQIYAFGNSEFSAEVPENGYMIPFGHARMRRAGDDISVLAYGAAAVRAAQNEAEFLAREGIDLEIIDIACLAPLDIDTLVVSAKKTGRVIIMHEASARDGCGVHVKHALDDAGATAYSRLPRSAYILAAESNPIPTKKEFLWARLPYAQYVVRVEDDFGEPRTIVRSYKLAVLAREAMKY